MSKIERWTDAQCKQIEPIWELAQARREAHYKAHRFFNRWYNIFTLPTVLVGAILSTLSFNSDTAPDGVAAGLAIFMTTTSTVNSYFNLAKRQEGHRQIYRGFNLLIREIEISLLRGQESPKRDFIDFLESVNDTFTKLVEDAPALNAGARAILTAARNDKPSPFDNLRGIGKSISIDIGEVDVETTIVESVVSPQHVPVNSI